MIFHHLQLPKVHIFYFRLTKWWWGGGGGNREGGGEELGGCFLESYRHLPSLQRDEFQMCIKELAVYNSRMPKTPPRRNQVVPTADGSEAAPETYVHHVLRETVLTQAHLTTYPTAAT